MLKDYFRSLLTAFRGSHKSVPQKLPINSDTTITTGSQHADENAFIAPADGFLSIQLEPPATTICIRDAQKLDWTRGESPYLDYRCKNPMDAGCPSGSTSSRRFPGGLIFLEAR